MSDQKYIIQHTGIDLNGSEGNPEYYLAPLRGMTNDIQEAHHYSEEEKNKIINRWLNSKRYRLEAIPAYPKIKEPTAFESVFQDNAGFKACNCTLPYEDCCGALKSEPKFVHTFSGTFKDNPLVEESSSQFGSILKSINRLLDYKNEKYGNSALEPLNIFSEFGSIGQRLDDKLARVKNCDELRKNDICDIIGYLVLLCKDKGWELFDEFMD